jgi:hypothetical protein
MRVLLRLFVITVAWLFALSAFAQDVYFPEKALSGDPWSDHFKSVWYSQELGCLKEPSLLDLSKDESREVYRFLWVRSFDHPVAIRLEVRADGTGMLTTKVANGEAGFLKTITHLIEDISRPLTREQTHAFLAQVKRSQFWLLPSSINDQTGTDGAEWIIEGVKSGKYHVVDRWSPKTGTIRELGLTFLFGVAQMNVPKERIY